MLRNSLNTWYGTWMPWKTVLIRCQAHCWRLWTLTATRTRGGSEERSERPRRERTERERRRQSRPLQMIPTRLMIHLLKVPVLSLSSICDIRYVCRALGVFKENIWLRLRNMFYFFLASLIMLMMHMNGFPLVMVPVIVAHSVSIIAFHVAQIFPWNGPSSSFALPVPA